jgi:hypothetical protein
MGEGLIAVIIMCVTMVTIALIVAYVVISGRRMTVAEQEAPHHEVPAQSSRRAYALGTEPKDEPVEPVNVPGFPHYEYSKTEQRWDVVPEHNGGLKPHETYDPATMAPLPVDPQRKPYARVYRPRPNSPYEPPRCVCHNRPLRADQTVLMWPLPGTDEVKIFCQKEAP